MGSRAALDGVQTLDPYTCIPKRNRKYASECTEVHLAKLGAEKISEEFSHFTSLEVIWLNGNRLSRIENLESNFRIREVYAENNRLVSLSGLRSFKFLKVLLASGNQLRNLEKQLSVLSHFAFLKKLELFDNPVAEEPDYRSRTIFHLPQVEILDRQCVKGLERQRAQEVVPNLDKVSAAKPGKASKRAEETELTKSCLRMAKEIRERRQREENLLLGQSALRITESDRPPPLPKRFLDGFKLDPTKRDLLRPTPFEKCEMRPLLEQRAGKPALTAADVRALAEDLAREGVDATGRVLSSGEVLRSAKGKAGGATNPLEKLLEDPEATVPTSEVVNYLLTLEWPHPDLQEAEGRRPHPAGMGGLGSLGQTRTWDVAKASFPRNRGDIFRQSLISPLARPGEPSERLTLRHKAPMAPEFHHTPMGCLG